ncbi:hypothetical protein HOY82DRAFT_598531 [Tuber indicum]|nr:hypothetical protein HOY82DRAFT_598531 [Tuber indicum]
MSTDYHLLSRDSDLGHASDSSVLSEVKGISLGDLQTDQKFLMFTTDILLLLLLLLYYVLVLIISEVISLIQ